jgi:hypothetical protein
VGLDILAVSQAAPHFLGPPDPEDAGGPGGLDDEYLTIAAQDAGERMDGYAPGYYRVRGEQVRFRAGSYTGYNGWRRHLCRMALGVEPETVWTDPERYQGQPFVELIDFSDCEGCIGPLTSKKLAGDFAAHAARAAAYAREHGAGRPAASEPDVVQPWWLEAYGKWQEAFTLAADQGFVLFV